MRKSPRRVTRAEVIKAAALLAQYIEKNPDGTVSYKDNWTDDKIAKAVALDLPVSSIESLRKELHGEFSRRVVSVDDERITRLEKETAALQSKLNEVMNLHAKLCDNLAINRVLDVRHLRGTPPASNGVAKSA